MIYEVISSTLINQENGDNIKKKKNVNSLVEQTYKTYRSESTCWCSNTEKDARMRYFLIAEWEIKHEFIISDIINFVSVLGFR